MLSRIVKNIDWILFVSLIPLLGAGLVTMYSFVGESYFFSRQLIWILVSLVVFFAFSLIDFRFLRKTHAIVGLFLFFCGVLLFLFITGSVFQGAQSWFNLGLFTVQPSDPIKLVLILVLAKYFSRRHVEIANFKHIVLSGIYALIPFVLVFLQPDFGSAIILFCIWLGMTIASGISKKHLALVFLVGMLAFGGLWSFVFEDYQKQRIMTFLNPLTDIQGTGYNANQAMIAVGSGQLLGKGVGYGTQSRLEFLPEYETDFIFAAFAEEWGFIGVLLVFVFFGIVIWRILMNAMVGATNFETFYAIGLAIFLIAHFTIHIGMNIGLLPVTGTTVPFLSYGGSHLLTEFMGLGILMGMRQYSRTTHRDNMKNELHGVG